MVARKCAWLYLSTSTRRRMWQWLLSVRWWTIFPVSFGRLENPCLRARFAGASRDALTGSCTAYTWISRRIECIMPLSPLIVVVQKTIKASPRGRAGARFSVGLTNWQLVSCQCRRLVPTTAHTVGAKMGGYRSNAPIARRSGDDFCGSCKMSRFSVYYWHFPINPVHYSQ
jgi:hypothetical protein